MSNLIFALLLDSFNCRILTTTQAKMKIRMNQSRNFFVVVISKNHDWTNKLSAPQESRSAIPMFGSVGVFASESRLQKGKEKWQEETSSLTGRGAGGQIMATWKMHRQPQVKKTDPFETARQASE